MVSPETLEFIAKTTVPQYHLSNYGLNTVLFKGERELIVAGYASPQVIDREKHLITKEALRNDLPRFMANPRYRNVNLLHSNVQVGEVIPEWTNPKTGETWKTKVDDIGLFAVIKVRTDANRPEIMDRVEQDILAGKLASFSISADAPFDSRRHECVNGTCFWVIDRIQLYEITICETPVNQNAKFSIISKSHSTGPNPAEFMSSAFCLDGSCPLTSAQIEKAGGIVAPQQPSLDITANASDPLGPEMGGSKYDDGSIESPAKPDSPTPSPKAKEARGVSKHMAGAFGSDMANVHYNDIDYDERREGAFTDPDNPKSDKAATGMADPGMSLEAAKWAEEEKPIGREGLDETGAVSGTRRALNLSDDNYYAIFASTASAMAEALNLYLMEGEDELITRAVLAAVQTGDIDYIQKGSTSEWIAWVPNGSGIDRSFININRHVESMLKKNVTPLLLQSHDVLSSFRPLSGATAIRALESSLSKMSEVMSHDLPSDVKGALRNTINITMSLISGYDARVSKSQQVSSKVMASKDALSQAVLALEDKVMNPNVRDILDSDTVSALDAAYDGIRNAIDGIALGDVLEVPEEPEWSIISESGADDTLGEVEQADQILESLDKSLRKAADDTLIQNISTEMANNIATDREAAGTRHRPPEVLDSTSLPEGNTEGNAVVGSRFGGVVDAIHNEPEHETLEEHLSKSINKAGSPDSAMIAWFLPPELARQVAIAGGEPVEELHCTIAILPDGMGEPQLKAVAELVKRVAADSEPLVGKLNGFGKFNPEPGQPDPWYAVVDVPGLSAFRTRMVEALKTSGIKIKENHDYSPHVTLLYGTPDGIPNVDNHEITIDNVVIAYGGSESGKRLDPIPFGGGIPKTTAESKSLSLSVTDHDVLSYGQVFDSMWRKGIRDNRFSLAVKAQREDGTVEYLDLGGE